MSGRRNLHLVRPGSTADDQITAPAVKQNKLNGSVKYYLQLECLIGRYGGSRASDLRSQLAGWVASLGRLTQAGPTVDRVVCTPARSGVPLAKLWDQPSPLNGRCGGNFTRLWLWPHYRGKRRQGERPLVGGAWTRIVPLRV